MSQWESTRAGRHLAGRKAKNTAPEVALRRAIHAAGGRFRLHRRIQTGCTPDFVLPRGRLAVFVDGCFWHGCPAHGRTTPWTGPNAALWEQKMQRNAERDMRSTRLAIEAGWHVTRVWECAIRENPAGVAEALLYLRTRVAFEEPDTPRLHQLNLDPREPRATATAGPASADR
ncbi:very short patch repair endonuclease [Terrabacter sp. 2TAF16]|uniref:very short patch repair endonuclease n=1 Tax=Terrabacter sp. 2TAF16 TaxID=3233008 RepID=UPI003F98164D